jgi:hypothetical protein
MSVVEAEPHGQIFLLRTSRPNRLDGRSQEMRGDDPQDCRRLPTLDSVKG